MAIHRDLVVWEKANGAIALLACGHRLLKALLNSIRDREPRDIEKPFEPKTWRTETKYG